MRKPVLVALTGGMVGAILAATVAIGPSASAAPRQLQSAGLLAPSIRFHFDGTGSIFQFGAVAQIDGTYSCSGTLDSPVLSQLLGSSSSLTMQLSEDEQLVHGDSGSQRITRGSDTINGLNCDGTRHQIAFSPIVTAGMTPFLDGPTVALVVMKVCDLLGCTEASSAGLVDLTTSS